LLEKVCILDTVLRHHSLKSVGATASAEMQSGRSPLMYISLKISAEKNEEIPEMPMSQRIT